MFGEGIDNRGMIPRAVEYVFESVASRVETTDFSISCSFLEIYNDSVRDLGKASIISENEENSPTTTREKTSDIFDNINKNRNSSFSSMAFKRINSMIGMDQQNNPAPPSNPLFLKMQEEYNTMSYEIHEDGEGRVFVKDLANIRVTCVEEIMHIIFAGLKVRATHETKMNNTSSRSHTVFTITVTQTDKLTLESVYGMLNLVDLAGSERLKKSESQGARLKEALHINTSLSALGKVVMALDSNSSTDVSSHHIPYRDSKLTRILQNSLGGNSYTTVMAAIHPCPRYYDECLSTLQFANRCRTVYNNPRVNYVGDGSMEDKDRKIRRLTEEINVLRNKLVQAERSHGGGKAANPFDFAEKITNILKKLGIDAHMGGDGGIVLASGQKISLEELNNTLGTPVSTSAENLLQLALTSGGSSTLVEKLKKTISDLDTDNTQLRQKAKERKLKAETLMQQVQQLTYELHREKQTLVTRDNEIKNKETANEYNVKYIQTSMDVKYNEAYKEMAERNKKLLEMQANLIANIPKNIKEFTENKKALELRKDEIIYPLKEAYEEMLAQSHDSRRVELLAQQSQYEYWLKQKDEKLEAIVEEFNKAHDKKNQQQRKIEQEVVQLFEHAADLEDIIYKAENGKFFFQQFQTTINPNSNNGTIRGNTLQSNDIRGDASDGRVLVRSGGLVLPKGMNPYLIRNVPEEFRLSRKILKKHKEHIKKNEFVQEKAFDDALLQLGKEENMGHSLYVDGAIQQQIKNLLSSPSVGRNLTTPNASKPATAHRSKSASSGGRTSSQPASNALEFHVITPSEPKVSKLESSRRSTNANTSSRTASDDIAQGSNVRAAQALQKKHNADSFLSSSGPNSAAPPDEDNRLSLSVSAHRDSKYQQFAANSSRIVELEEYVRKLHEELNEARFKLKTLEQVQLFYGDEKVHGMCYHIISFSL